MIKLENKKKLNDDFGFTLKPFFSVKSHHTSNMRATEKHNKKTTEA